MSAVTGRRQKTFFLPSACFFQSTMVLIEMSTCIAAYH
jgi:hypothetical protein